MPKEDEKKRSRERSKYEAERLLSNQSYLRKDSRGSIKRISIRLSIKETLLAELLQILTLEEVPIFDRPYATLLLQLLESVSITYKQKEKIKGLNREQATKFLLSQRSETCAPMSLDLATEKLTPSSFLPPEVEEINKIEEDDYSFF